MTDVIAVPKNRLIGQFGLGLQRTCKLVDEWTAKYNATTEEAEDEDFIFAEASTLIEGAHRVHYRLVKRHYRVVYDTPERRLEAERITMFVKKHHEGHTSWVEKWALPYLRENGYSEEAINEVLNSPRPTKAEANS